MGQVRGQQKRDMLAIMLRILDIANEPVKKTHILYSAGINFYQLSRYLNYLLKLGLIEELAEPYQGFRTTEKGRACLELFKYSELEVEAIMSPPTNATIKNSK